MLFRSRAYLENNPSKLLEVELKVREHYNLNIPKELTQGIEENKLEEFQMMLDEDEE